MAHLVESALIVLFALVAVSLQGCGSSVNSPSLLDNSAISSQCTRENGKIKFSCTDKGGLATAYCRSGKCSAACKRREDDCFSKKWPGTPSKPSTPSMPSEPSKSSGNGCTGLKHNECDTKSECDWLWTEDWKTSCMPKGCTGLTQEICKLKAAKNQCSWQFTGDWKTSCKSAGASPIAPKTTTTTTTTTSTKKTTPAKAPSSNGCSGLQHVECDASNKCEWLWTEDWKTSCMPKGCTGLTQEVCKLKAAKNQCSWQWTGDWKTSCKSGGASPIAPKTVTSTTTTTTTTTTTSTKKTTPAKAPSSNGCSGLKHNECDTSSKCEWLWTEDWKTSCMPKGCTGLTQEVCKLKAAKNQCSWQFTGDWKTSCKSAGASPITTTTTTSTTTKATGNNECKGLKNADCSSSSKCEWVWNGDWKTSCLPTGCTGLTQEQCGQKAVKNKCSWQWTGDWKTSCKSGGSTSLAEKVQLVNGGATPISFRGSAIQVHRQYVD